MAEITLSSIISPQFFEVHKSLKESLHTHYWLKGGRGSTKSSFISLEIIMGIMRDPTANGLCIRKVGTDLDEKKDFPILLKDEALLLFKNHLLIHITLNFTLK